MDTKKRNIIIAAASVGLAVILLVVIAVLGMFRGFNAERYVNAVLDQTFKGKVETLADMTKGVGKEDLIAQYETGIASFAKSNIAGGIQMDEELEAKYVALCKKIFADMKYNVKSEEKLKGDIYEVTVQYQAADIIQKYSEAATTVIANLNAKVQSGEYRGTAEEITAQMQQDFLKEVYPLLEEAHKNMKYGEKETMVITVEKSENDLYKIGEGQVADFLKKILDIDEKQD